MAPVDLPIRTSRMLLRPFDDADLPAFADMRARPDVVRYLYEEPLSLEEARASLQRKAGLVAITDEGGGLALVMERTDDGAFLGDVGLWLVDAPNRGAELGFVLHPDHQGRGYAREATRTL